MTDSDKVQKFYLVVRCVTDKAFGGTASVRAYEVPSGCTAPYACRVWSRSKTRKIITEDMKDFHAQVAPGEYMRYTIGELKDLTYGVIYGQAPGADVFSDVYEYFVVRAMNEAHAVWYGEIYYSKIVSYPVSVG